MISKEQLQRISDLNLSGRLNKMSENQFFDYVQTLNAFIDRFPASADNLRRSLDAGSYHALLDTLSGVYDSLTNIYADGLARECRRQIDSMNRSGVSGIDYDDVQSFIENFIQSVSAMSIEIQMASHRSEKNTSFQKSSTGFSGREPVLMAVDNAVMFLNTLQKLLRDAPYELHCFSTCSDALDFLKTNKPDAILLDIEMPDMDGYELARRIKQSGQRAPIIFITANSSRQFIDKAVEVGAAGLLMKPIRVAQLLAKLKEVV